MIEANDSFMFSQPSTRLSIKLNAGFGSPSSSSSNINQGNNQIKNVNDEIECPCCSNEIFSKCCGRYLNDNNDNKFPQSIEETVRARYTSYAIGNADFLIDSTHPEHKDYQRHLESSSGNSKKIRKIWSKEIITQNSEAFEFLKLEILDHNIELNTCTFNVLVRNRLDGQVVPFKETSTFISNNDPNNIVDRPLTNNNPKKNKENDIKFLYLKGEVDVMDEETIRRLIADAPKYVKQSIRDQW